MDFGAAIFFTDYSMGPVELGRALEERGFESLWAPEHSHIPLSRRSPFPQGGDLPKKYYDVMDPFVTLSAAAAATTRAPRRDGHLPRRPARSHPDGQGGRHARPGLRRPVPLRHRRGLERRGDGGSRHRVRLAVQGDAGARGGDAGDLDQVQAGVQRRARAVPADDDVAEAGAEAAPARHRRRRLSLRRPARHRLWRRLAAPRPPARLRRRARAPARLPQDGRRGRA